MGKETQQMIWKVLANTSRFLLAVVFIFSGFVKANDPYGMVFKLQEYSVAFGLESIPFLTLIIISVMLAVLEFSIGVHLLFGMSKVIIAKLTLAFMSLMTIITAYIWAFDPVADCGCFGDVLILSNGMTFAKNIVLLAAAVVNLKYNHLYVKLVGHNTRWLITLFCMIYIFAYTLLSMYTLPWLDTSPYKMGTDMRSEEGRMATAGFFVTDIETGEDITDSIVQGDGYIFVLSIPNLHHADEGCIDQVNEIYEYSKKYGYPFYCLTATTDEESRHYWIDHTGAEYSFYESDESELRTLIRSSPGLLLIKDGVILSKWSNYMLPDEERRSGPLETVQMGQNLDIEGRKLTDLLVYFLLPLVLIILIDRIGSGFGWYRRWRHKTKNLQLEQIKKQIKNQIK